MSNLQRIVEALLVVPDNQKRELIILLQKIDVPTHYASLIFDTCSSLWTKINKQPSLRLNAFKLMAMIAARYAGLYKELILLNNPMYTSTLSLTVKKSIARIMNNSSN